MRELVRRGQKQEQIVVGGGVQRAHDAARMILDGAEGARDRLLVVGTGIDRIAFIGVDVGGNAGGDPVEIGDLVDGGGKIRADQPSARRGRFERQSEGLALAWGEVELVGNEAFALARR